MKSKSKDTDFVVHDIKGKTFSNEAIIGICREVLDKGKALKIKVSGTSMSPFIKDGDIVTISPFRDKSIQQGDIVAAIHSKNGQLIVHRVIKRKDRHFLLCGDSLYEPDGMFTTSDILGIITCVERKGRKVFSGIGAEKKLIAFLTDTRHFPLFLNFTRKCLHRLHLRKPS